MSKKDVVTANGAEAKAAAVDPHSGKAVDVNIGATPHPVDDWESTPESRGDFVPEPEPAKSAEPSDPVAQDAEEEGAKAAAEGAEAEDEAGKSAAEGEETPPEGDAAKEKVKDGEKRSKVVPRERFDEVNARRKALEEENARLKAAQAKPQAAEEQDFDFDAAEEQYQDLVLDGKKAEAKALRAQIRAADEARLLKKAAEVAEKTYGNKKTAETVESITAEAMATYDVFDPESENYNEELVDEVEALMVGYQSARKLSPEVALRKALDTVVKMNGLGKAEAEPEPEPTPEPTPQKVNVRKKIAEAEKTPKAIGKSGVGAAVIGASNPDVMQMTDQEWDALPESTRRRLRGDTL